MEIITDPYFIVIVLFNGIFLFLGPKVIQKAIKDFYKGYDANIGEENENNKN